MKAVLKSESPASCELIVNGKKTILLSKKCPKLEPPFKCYIYETKGKCYEYGLTIADICKRPKVVKIGGKVIGEFMCDKIICCQAYNGMDGYRHLTNLAFVDVNSICLSEEELWKYIAKPNAKVNDFSDGWLWHISDLKIYDAPKELGEFSYPACKDAKHCDNCPSYENLGYPYDDQCSTNRFKRVTRPPQSWCYVEELLKRMC